MCARSNTLFTQSIYIKQRTNAAGENSSFIFSVKSVPRYHFKLADVVPHITVREFFETHL